MRRNRKRVLTAAGWAQVVAIAAVVATSCAYVGRVSIDVNGGDPDGESVDISLSEDGRYVAFASFATDLVANDTNGTKDIFVRDNQTGVTEAVSLSSSGGVANGLSGQPDISADGRFVTFWSFADDIVANDINGASDVFLHDRQTGTTERVSVDGNGGQATAGALGGSVSDDGRRIAFYSLSPLSANDTNTDFDVYLRDRLLGNTVLISRNPSLQAVGASFDPILSRDGTMVTWWSGNDGTTTDDTNGRADVFVRSTISGIGVMVSYTPSFGGADGDSYSSDISDDGLYVLFSSRATNLVPGDTNGASDVFRRDVLGNETKNISDGNAGSFGGSISGDGSIASFGSGASDFPGPDGASDTNGFDDVFLWEDGDLTMASTTVAGQALNGHSSTSALSRDGSAVGFQTLATNVGSTDGNGERDVIITPTFLPRINEVTHDLLPGATADVTIDGDFEPGATAILGGDGIVSSSSTQPTEDQLILTVTLSPTASIGLRTLFVAQPAPQLGFPYPLGSGDSVELLVTVN